MVELIAETHTYVNDKFPKMKETSVTTVLGEYKEKFDEVFHARYSAVDGEDWPSPPHRFIRRNQV